jgi:hypothetical protein
VIEKGVPHGDLSIRRETLHAAGEKVIGFSEDFWVIESIVKHQK